MQSSDLEFREQRRSKQAGRARLWFLLGCLAVITCLTGLMVVLASGIFILDRLERRSGEVLAAVSATETPPETPRLTPLAQAPADATITLVPTASDLNELTSPIQNPTPTMTPAANVPSLIQQEPLPTTASQYLSALLTTDFPPRDYYETAQRLGSTEVGRRKIIAQQYEIGDRRDFVTDEGIHEALLMAVTEHAYFWSETTLTFSQEQFTEAANRFEADYLPSLVKLYGIDWQNGIDDDLRFSVLHLDGYADGTELGFFNSGDQYPRSVNSSSNEQEVIYLNMENLRPGDPLYFGTLVHELQHLVQWHSDPNEPVWLSEGLAQFTELYVGLETVDTPPDYLDKPSTRLNTWLQDAGEEIFAHYGATYLFAVYFWEQLGDTAIQGLMQEPVDGLAGINAVLSEAAPGLPLDQFVLDWATANYLDDITFGSKYAYNRLDLERPRAAYEVRQAPFDTLETQDQFGVSYVELDLQGQFTMTFAGDTSNELLPVWAHSGESMWFAPPLNDLDAHMTAAFDLTGLTDANLGFWTWYDLEEGYDFAYISVSRDGGLSWDLLMPQHAVAGEFGPGLSGRSDEVEGNVGGWLEEHISLATYAGESILIRFEVLSDSAIAETGFAIDDIAIAELGYMDDVETANGEWQTNGFVRTGQLLPQIWGQIWGLNLILPGPSPQVMTLELNDRNQGQWTIDLGRDGAVLVITAQTPFVSNPADYWLAVDP